MLVAIRDIGRWSIRHGRAEVDVRDGSKIVFLKFSENCRYMGAEVEDFIPPKATKYLYEPGQSKGNRPSPVAQITSPGKTLKKKIVAWIKKGLEYAEKDHKDLIEKLLESFQKVEEETKLDIEERLDSIYSGIPKNKRSPVYLGIKIEDRYIGQLEPFKTIAKKMKSEKLSEISASQKVCSVCGEIKEFITGDNSDIYRFYTIDKPGFIIGGFLKPLAWRNYPLCIECREELKAGRAFTEKYLKQKFVDRVEYFTIPKLMVPAEETLGEILEIFSELPQNVFLKERIVNRLTEDEQEILEIISEKSDVLTLNFLFFEKSGGSSSAEKILHLIEDVFPSRLREIFNAKKAVDTLFSRSFTFYDLRVFFSKSDEDKRNYDLDRYFLEIINSIFKGIKVDLSFIMKFLMLKLRKNFIKARENPQDMSFHETVTQAIMSLMFLQQLNLIDFKEEAVMEQGGIFDSLFEKYGKALNSPEKRGLFLLGTLTQMLLNVQYAKRDSAPFMKKLKGLKMERSDILRLMPEVRAKLEEYESFDKGKQQVAEEATKMLLQSDDKWNLSVDEINFYFCAGMNLSKEVANIVYQKSNEEV